MHNLAENRANNTDYHLKHKLFYAQGAVIPVTAVPSLGTVFYSQRVQTSLYATNLSQKEQAGLEEPSYLCPHLPVLHQSHDQDRY